MSSVIADCHVVNINVELGVQSAQTFHQSVLKKSLNISPNIQSQNVHRRTHLKRDHFSSREDISQIEGSVSWVEETKLPLPFIMFIPTYLSSNVYRVTA